MNVIVTKSTHEVSAILFSSFGYIYARENIGLHLCVMRAMYFLHPPIFFLNAVKKGYN